MLAFFRDTAFEVKKLYFPSRKETYITTLIVLITVIISSLVILFADFIISKVIAIIFGL